MSVRASQNWYCTMLSVVCLLFAVLTATAFAESELKAALNSRRLQMLKKTENNSRFSITHNVSRSALESLGTKIFHSQSSSEQTALEEFYDATNGDSWTSSTGWNTDSDLNNWFGVTATSSTVVTYISLNINNLAGEVFPSD
jgi:hypothetical protein